MTAPDYRPYLLATDLRTPEDVLAWLRAIGPLYLDLSYHLARLLDRERRQAYEKGWQAHAAASLQRGRQARSARQKGWTEWAALRESDRAHHMTLALAFRAAARQP